MNCCDANGKCTQGYGCPVRIQYVNRECHEPEDDTGYIPTLCGAIVLAFVCAIIGLALGVYFGGVK
jgi:hypothetical protein